MKRVGGKHLTNGCLSPTFVFTDKQCARKVCTYAQPFGRNCIY